MTRLKWEGDAFLGELGNKIKIATRNAAELVAQDARRRCPVGQHEGLHLRDQIDVIYSGDKKDHAHFVWAQPPRGPKYSTHKYYASFVELGTWKDAAQPFLRPALHSNKGRILRAYADIVK